MTFWWSLGLTVRTLLMYQCTKNILQIRVSEYLHTSLSPVIAAQMFHKHSKKSRRNPQVTTQRKPTHLAQISQATIYS